MKKSYGGIDVGSSICEISVEDQDGEEVFHKQFATGERNLLQTIQEAKGRFQGEFHLAIEEGEMAQWLAGILRPRVDRFVICDPKRNAWIAKDRYKNDRVDARRLAKLLRGNFLKEIHHPQDIDRAEFKRVVQHYHSVTRNESRLKCLIKARLRAQGVIIKVNRDPQPDSREAYISRVPSLPGQQVLRQLYMLLDTALEAKDQAEKLMVAMGRKYPEVVLLRSVYGVGPIWACTFSAYIQTPFRFKDKHKLWKYCGLSITDQSSNGQPLAYHRLDRNGVSMLKNLSYHVFMTNMMKDTDFRRFYRASLERTQDKTHARLNTQRKILAVLWAMWKSMEVYRSQGGVEKAARYKVKYLADR